LSKRPRNDGVECARAYRSHRPQFARDGAALCAKALALREETRGLASGLDPAIPEQEAAEEEARRAPPTRLSAYPRFIRLSTRSVPTVGSARVETSPSGSCSLAAILRRILRMILPLRVFGRLGAHWMRSGEAMGPMCFLTHATSSLRRGSLGSLPVLSVT